MIHHFPRRHSTSTGITSGRNLRTFEQIEALSDIGEIWTEMYFDIFSLFLLRCTACYLPSRPNTNFKNLLRKSTLPDVIKNFILMRLSKKHKKKNPKSGTSDQLYPFCSAAYLKKVPHYFAVLSSLPSACFYQKVCLETSKNGTFLGPCSPFWSEVM